jgi:hypothetical protein
VWMLGSMDSAYAGQTRTGQGLRIGFVTLASQTEKVPTTERGACRQRAASVPGGAKRGGIQRSALWNRWDKRFSNSAYGLGLAIGAGPIAHKFNQVLSVPLVPLVAPVLLEYGCWTAGLNCWTGLSWSGVR